MALLFVAAGANHFIFPSGYLEIMPPYLPRPLELIYISGAAEIFLGLCVLFPRARRMAGWGLIALLCAVYPANVHMALHGFRVVPMWVLWARLPFQFILIAWVYWSCLASKRE